MLPETTVTTVLIVGSTYACGAKLRSYFVTYTLPNDADTRRM